MAIAKLYSNNKCTWIRRSPYICMYTFLITIGHSFKIVESLTFCVNHLICLLSSLLKSLRFLWSLHIMLGFVTSIVLQSAVFVTIDLTLPKLIKLLLVKCKENPRTLHVSLPLLVLNACFWPSRHKSTMCSSAFSSFVSSPR